MPNNNNDSQELNNLKAKVESIIDMISNRPELAVDSANIKDFIDKYSIVKTLLDSDTLNGVVEKISELNKNIDTIQKETEGPLLVAQQQSQKIIDMYSKKDVSLSLNIADVKSFKSEVYKSFKDFMNYLKDLDIDNKVEMLKQEIVLAKNLKNDLMAQKDAIQALIKKTDIEDQLIQKIQKVNEDQDTKIKYLDNLIVTIEKQIENYAFFANEFNKIYINAKEFMTRFAEALETLEYIEERDDVLYDLVKRISSLLTTNFETINEATKNLSYQIESYTKEMLSWLNTSMMFVNEVKAYNLSLSAYNNTMDNISNRMGIVSNKLDNISLS